MPVTHPHIPPPGQIRPSLSGELVELIFWYSVCSEYKSTHARAQKQVFLVCLHVEMPLLRKLVITT